MPRPRLPVPKPAADRPTVRVNLSLSPEIVRTLDRISDRTGTARATLLREMIEQAAPTFVQMADALDLAAEKKIGAFKVLADALDSVGEQAGQLSLDIQRTRRRAMRRKKAE